MTRIPGTPPTGERNWAGRSTTNAVPPERVAALEKTVAGLSGYALQREGACFNLVPVDPNNKTPVYFVTPEDARKTFGELSQLPDVKVFVNNASGVAVAYPDGSVRVLRRTGDLLTTTLL